MDTLVQRTSERLIVVGAGVAGLSLAIWLRRFALDPLVLDESPAGGGQLRSLGNTIPDYPGFVAISGRALAEYLDSHACSAGADIRHRVCVQSICTGSRTVHTSAGVYGYSRLIIASGSHPRRLGVPGESDMIERGEVYSAARDARQFNGRTVVVVGGGDRAAEGGLLLAEAGARVILIHRGPELRARPHFVEQIRACERITIKGPAEVVGILGTDKVAGVEIRHRERTIKIECGAVLVRIGVMGHSSFVPDTIQRDSNGFVIVDSLCRASEPYVWAIGDVVAHSLISSISTAAGHAALVAKQLSMESARLREPVGGRPRY
jgi:thioredoxin reductase (NADPH)